MYQLLEKLFEDATHFYTLSGPATEVTGALQPSVGRLASADVVRPSAAPKGVRDPLGGEPGAGVPAMRLRGGVRVPARTPARPGAELVAPPVQRTVRATFAEGSFVGRNGSRSYKLFTPAGAAGSSLPLVVMLHGCSQSPDDFAAGTRMNELAQERGFLVLYPEQAPRSNSSKCWNWFVPGDQRRGSGEPDLLAAMTRHVMQRHGVDPRRVYIAGLSAGGSMADIMGREYPDLYAAVGVHSGVAQGAAHDVSTAFAVMRNGTGGGGSMPGRQEPSGSASADTGSSATPRRRGKGVRLVARQAAAIVFHGDRDATVHPSNGNEVIERVVQAAGGADRVTASIEQAALAGRSVTRTVHRRQAAAATEPSLAEHWVVHGAGHAWSGGSTLGSFTDAAGPDATREMVRFFEAHPLAPV